MTEQAVSRVQRGGLQVASELDALIVDQALPGTRCVDRRVLGGV